MNIRRGKDMGIFDKLREPIFLKETSQAERQLEELQRMLMSATGDVRCEIERDIKLLTYGIEGERNIAFELKNSHMPMYILHDLYLEYGTLSAQIDYLVITRGYTFVIECKNLIGNIEINSSGDFIRSYKWGNKIKKEGIYSPITQNKRHLELLKQIQCQGKNILRTTLINRMFYKFNKSIVVLSNPKTILNAKYAKKEVKEQVIRVDQLIEFIRRENDKFTEGKSSDKQMLENAQYYLSWNRQCNVDYMAKYRQVQINPVSVGNDNFISSEPKVVNSTYTAVQSTDTNGNMFSNNNVYPNNNTVAPVSPMLSNCSIENMSVNVMETQVISPNIAISNVEQVNPSINSNQNDLEIRLKKYRLLTSRKEGIKPYYIFNDAQMTDLIQKMPRNLDELLKVAGFGPKKCEKYGKELLEVLWGYK